MGRLIDADELKRNVLKWMPKDQSDYMDSAIPPLENLTVSMVMEIDDAPTVDAVPVLCKDCKHRDPEDRKCDCGHDIMWQLPRGDDWYCADGERKDGDHAEGTIQKERS